MKRILSLFLVFLLIPCMVFPASAAETKTNVDLMGQGYFYVNGEPVDDFSFISSGTDFIEFPVDVIGGMGDVEFVIQCASDVTLKSESNVTITKSALSIPNTVWYTKDLNGETSEVFYVTTTKGARVTFISAQAYYPGSLSVALPFDYAFRAGSYKKDAEDVLKMVETIDIEDHMSSSVYTTYVSNRFDFDVRDIAGLDSIDLTIFTTGISPTSIAAYSASNVYIPVSYSMHESADPAVERNRIVVHMDISNVPYNEWVYLYFYGVTTSSSSSFRFEVQQIMGYIERPGSSGEVGLLQKIWLAVQKVLLGDSDSNDDFEDEMTPIESEADEMADALETAPSIDIEGIEDEFDGLIDWDADTDLMGAFSTVFDDNAFSKIIVMSITLALLGYILYGKR